MIFFLGERFGEEGSKEKGESLGEEGSYGVLYIMCMIRGACVHGGGIGKEQEGAMKQKAGRKEGRKEDSCTDD